MSLCLLVENALFLGDEINTWVVLTARLCDFKWLWVVLLPRPIRTSLTPRVFNLLVRSFEHRVAFNVAALIYFIQIDLNKIRISEELVLSFKRRLSR